MAKDPNNLVLIHFVMIIHNQTKSINTLKNIINNPSKNNNSKRKEKKQKSTNTLNKKQKVSITDSSGLSIQEKENITSYQQGNNENTFNAPSPILENLTLFFIQDELPCLFCDQPLPNPLPKKLLEYLKTLRRKKKILETDRGDFCFMHHAELKIVPLGGWFRELALSIYNELGQQPGYYGPKGEIAIAAI
ncbi:hypothetical protein RhiirA4_451417 [Rhizophagus irregularis]|uniref:Restriction of telomere capping protein 4 n=1 Tax=Rhizophagus irregularis TaxID=588596 RepID=A0A2I1FVP8_9GLOM|nr:hypothetical protein RhiirA4_451417 [Rhizophagus irregularis]